MIKIENVDVFGWEAAIRGMRNPMNSWDKSDSGWDGYSVGTNDAKLMKILTNAGDDHGKVIRFIEVYADITAPLYWWKEFRTYRKGRKFMDDGDDFTDVDDLDIHIETNSCSTMHKIHAKKFELDDFSHEHLFPNTISVGGNTLVKHGLGMLADIVFILNAYRDDYLKTQDKRYWWQMIQLLPSSYNQKRTVKLNYQALRRMYHARKNHKLDEWRDFCKWCETLPYFKEICVDE